MVSASKKKRCIAGLALCLAALLLAPACLTVDNSISVEKDGSGTVILEVRYKVDTAPALGRTFGSLGSTSYPPLSLWNGALQKLFPGPDFSIEYEELEEEDIYLEEGPEEDGEEGLQEEEGEGGPDAEAGYTATIAFKDINSLAESPYGRAVGLSAETADGVFTLRRLHGCEALAFFAARAPEILSDPGIRRLIGEMEADQAELLSRVSLTLPAAISKSNGKLEGNTASWTFSSKELEKEESKVPEPLFASCPAKDLGFTPRPGLVPALHRFPELKGMHTESASPPPAKSQIQAAAKAEADKLVIQGGMAYEGQHLTSISRGALLSGAISLPPELAPRRNTPVRLAQAMDEAGNSLVLSPKALRRSSMYDFQDRDEAKGNAGRIPFSLRFQAPHWNAASVGPFSIETGLIYFSGLRAFPIEKIASRNQVNKLSSPESVLYQYTSSPSGQSLRDPELSEAGIQVLTGQMGECGGITSVAVSTIAAPGAIREISLFDGDGKPIPALAKIEQGRTKEKDKAAMLWTLIFAGRPPFPWSLAVVANDKPAIIPLSLRLPRISLISGEEPGKEAP